MIRILHIVTMMNRGGIETMLMNYYRHIDRSMIQFDFLVHRTEKCDYDDEIRALGGKIYHVPRLNPFSFAYRKELYAFFRAHPEYMIIHVHQDCFSGISLKIAEKCGIPFRIAHSHISNVDFDLKLPIRLIFRMNISKYATNLLACSDIAGKFMFKNVNYSIMHNAINVDEYSFSINKKDAMRKSREQTRLVGF